MIRGKLGYCDKIIAPRALAVYMAVHMPKTTEARLRQLGLSCSSEEENQYKVGERRFPILRGHKYREAGRILDGGVL